MTNITETIDQVLLQIVRVPERFAKTLPNFKDSEFPQVSVRSPCIKKHGTMTEKTNKEEIELEEMNQTYKKPIGPVKPSGPYSTWDKSKNKKSIQIKLHEYLYEIGAHVDLVDRIGDVENPVRIPVLVQLLTF